MKFINNFSLYLIGIAIGLTIGSVLFESNVSIFTWLVAIAVSVSYALTNNRNKGKHDE